MILLCYYKRIAAVLKTFPNNNGVDNTFMSIAQLIDRAACELDWSETVDTDTFQLTVVVLRAVSNGIFVKAS